MAGPASNSGANAASSTRAAENRVKAFELRKLGMSYRAIGEELGVTLKTAYQYVRFVLNDLAEQAKESAVEVRDMELERLDAGIVTVQGVISDPDAKPDEKLRAVNQLVKIGESRRKLLGLDAAQKVDHTSKGEGISLSGAPAVVLEWLAKQDPAQDEK